MAGDLTQGDEPEQGAPGPGSASACELRRPRQRLEGLHQSGLPGDVDGAEYGRPRRCQLDTHLLAMSDMPPHPLKFESRLKTISGKGKPLYVTEFGARRTRPAGTDGPGTDDKWDEQRSSYTVRAGLAKGTKLDFSSGTTTEAATSPTKHPSPWTTEARSRSTSLSTASSPSPPSRCHVFPQPEPWLRLIVSASEW
jgi:hypothetical protein